MEGGVMDYLILIGIVGLVAMIILASVAAIGTLCVKGPDVVVYKAVDKDGVERQDAEAELTD